MKQRLALLSMLLVVISASVWLVACTAKSSSNRMAPSAIGHWDGVPDNGEPWAPTVISPSGADEVQSILDQFEAAAVQARVEVAPEHTDVNVLASPTDDIWILVKPRPRDEQAQDNNDAQLGGGAMLAIVNNPVQQSHGEDTPPNWQPTRLVEGRGGVTPIDRTTPPTAEPTLIPLPLKHTDVSAQVSGYIATVDVTQQFHNPFAQKIEAVYQFPLPHDAAVSEFVMQIGDRQIRGIVREKEEAEQLYRQAREQGFNVALLTQVRPNIFEQKIANIEPGKQIDVSIRYFNTLSYADGWYTFVFPMVVGPRFNPPHSADPVRAVPHGTPPVLDEQGQRVGTDIAYLRPDERSGHDIALTLDIDAGVSIEEAMCVTHVVSTTPDAADPGKLHVELSPNDTLPNKDFIFAFRIAGDQMKQGLLTHIDPQTGEGYFTLMLYPPAELEGLSRQPMEMVFVLDCSGSMHGEPLAQAKDAIRRGLRHLQAGDTFQIIRFSSDASQLGERPVPATPANIQRALRYVDGLQSRGGTMMIEGIKAALDFAHDPARYRVVTFLTDGFIGNEREILREMNQRIGNARVFSFGVGSSVNRFLLERMAGVGRGAVAYLLPGDSGADIMDAYFNRISHPAMTNLSVSFGDANVTDVYPTRTPDLIVGRPVILTGRFTGELDTIHITPAPGTPGSAPGNIGEHDLAIRIDADEARPGTRALAQVWARRKIMDLMDQAALEGDDRQYRQAVLDTALRYQLMSQYTAFIAIDASRITEGDHSTTVPQPLPMPEGVQYDTTVEE